MIIRIKFIVLCCLCALISAPCFAYEDCPKGIHNSYECAKYLEHLVTKEFSSLIKRKGSILEIKLSDGREEILKNNEDGDESKSFSLVKYFPNIQYGLLHIQFYEGSTYDLIDMKTGKRTNVGGYAVLSPDKRRIAISHLDIDAGYAPNVLSIYLVTPKGLVQEFGAKPEWGPDDLKWKDNKTISFNRVGWKVGEPVIIKESHILSLVGQNIEKVGKWEADGNLQLK